MILAPLVRTPAVGIVSAWPMTSLGIRTLVTVVLIMIRPFEVEE